MNRASWFEKVRDRASADQDQANGLFILVSNGDWYSGAAPSGTGNAPYAVVVIVDDPASDGFGLNMVTVTWRIHYHASPRDLAAGHNFIARCYGDGQRSPAYGFHRWVAGSLQTTGWTASASEFVTKGDESEADFAHLWIEFRTIISKSST